MPASVYNLRLVEDNSLHILHISIDSQIVFVSRYFVSLQLGNQEATWVVADYIASSGSNELSVSKGQQVEIIEPPTASEPDFCLVRLNPQHDDSAVQEGLVPVAVLKPPPGAHKQGSSGAAATAAAAAGAAQKPNNDNSMQDQGEFKF